MWRGSRRHMVDFAVIFLHKVKGLMTFCSQLMCTIKFVLLEQCRLVFIITIPQLMLVAGFIRLFDSSRSKLFWLFSKPTIPLLFRKVPFLICFYLVFWGHLFFCTGEYDFSRSWWLFYYTLIMGLWCLFRCSLLWSCGTRASAVLNCHKYVWNKILLLAVR